MKDESRATSSIPRHKTTVIVIITAAVVVIASFAGSAYVRKDASARDKAAAPAEGVSSQQGPTQDRVETELITLHETGFEPNEITRPQGAFVLGVDNRSGLDEVELRFQRATGERIPALQTPKRKISWRDVVDLAPGHYVLSEANHPEWTCNVRILPR
jgi:hypothetical protein